jgi:Domain of unknown function DUF29
MDPAKVYDTDVVTWAERQAALLRRMAAGERVNDQVDWENVIEEVESVGRSEVETVMSLLINVMDHKLRLIGWPDHAAANHWRHEIRPWLARIAKRCRASMHIEAEMKALFRIARLDTDAHMLDAGPSPVALPDVCPWTLDELLAEGEAVLHYRSPPHP